MKRNVYLVLILISLLLAACGGSGSSGGDSESAPAETSNEAADFLGITDPEELFINNCAKCHGLGGLGDGPSVGSLRTQAGLNLTILTDKTDEELYETISTGKGSDMAPWELVLTAEQRQGLVQYIRTLQK